MDGFGFGPIIVWFGLASWLLAVTNAIYRCRLILQGEAKTLNIEKFLLKCNLGPIQPTKQPPSIDKRRALHHPASQAQRIPDKVTFFHFNWTR